MPSGTIELHRVLRSPPARVYKAFLDPEAKAKWLPPRGHTCKVHHFDARVDGSYRMSFTNFASGHGHAFAGVFRELAENQRLRYTDIFEDPGLPGEMQTTVMLRAVTCGCELRIVQEGIPQAIPPEMCYLGWQDSLAQLALLVEPDITD